MSHIYPENRIAYVGTTRRISLVDTALDGVDFDDGDLGVGDYVRYTVYLEDDTVWVATTSADWGMVYTLEDGSVVSGFTDVITMPDDAQTIKIIWEYALDPALDIKVDYITVEAIP